MSYYDYEAEPNFPEVEEIINEATDKFDKFMHETFAEEYKHIELAKQSVSFREKQAQELLASVNEKEQELQEREADLTKAEEEQYEKLKLKWFRELGLAFDIGETVYYHKDVTKNITCPTCNGAKKLDVKVEGADNSILECKIDCPTCHGWGTVKSNKEYEVIEAKVTSIEARIIKGRSGSVEVNHSNGMGELTTYVWVEDKKYRESKRLSGCDLYKTKEDCEEAIKALKAKETK